VIDIATPRTVRRKKKDSVYGVGRMERKKEGKLVFAIATAAGEGEKKKKKKKNVDNQAGSGGRGQKKKKKS